MKLGKCDQVLLHPSEHQRLQQQTAASNKQSLWNDISPKAESWALHSGIQRWQTFSLPKLLPGSDLPIFTIPSFLKCHHVTAFHVCARILFWSHSLPMQLHYIYSGLEEMHVSCLDPGVYQLTEESGFIVLFSNSHHQSPYWQHLLYHSYHGQTSPASCEELPENRTQKGLNNVQT